MSKHNYRNDFTSKLNTVPETNNTVLEEEDDEVCAACTINYPEDDVTEPEAPVVEEAAKTMVTGIVTGCARLNVRNDPSTTARILCALNESTEVMIDEDDSTEDFYKVCTATGVEGYCMKDFITLSFSTK
jgi:hypothetical protein